MLAQVLQIFLGKEHLVKNWLISTPDKVIYFKGTKPLFTSKNRVEKILSLFSNMLLLFRISMASTRFCIQSIKVEAQIRLRLKDLSKT
jgi:hypothetical protein